MLEHSHTRKFTKELMAGLSSLVLLNVLAKAGREMYGYEIAKALSGSSDSSFFKQGAIYPVLRSLDALGLLKSRIAPQGSGPPRRYYEITFLGLEALQDWSGAWASMRNFVDSALEEKKI